MEEGGEGERGAGEEKNCQGVLVHRIKGEMMRRDMTEGVE